MTFRDTHKASLPLDGAIHGADGPGTSHPTRAWQAQQYPQRTSAPSMKGPPLKLEGAMAGESFRDRRRPRMGAAERPWTAKSVSRKDSPVSDPGPPTRPSDKPRAVPAFVRSARVR